MFIGQSSLPEKGCVADGEIMFSHVHVNIMYSQTVNIFLALHSIYSLGCIFFYFLFFWNGGVEGLFCFLQCFKIVKTISS